VCAGMSQNDFCDKLRREKQALKQSKPNEQQHIFD